MKKQWVIILGAAFILFLIGYVPIAARSWLQNDDKVKDGEVNESAPSHNSVEAVQAVGDEIFRVNLWDKTSHDVLLGVEYVDGNYYLTSGGGLNVSEPNYLIKIDGEGNILGSWQQPTVASDFGWRDLAWDGSYLYGSDSAYIVQINPGTGQVTGVTIPTPLAVARAIAYDPATDHFWTANWNSPIYEIDRGGNVISSISNPYGIYGLGWDMWSDDGPYLWAWSQDGTPSARATQIDPTQHAFTGVSFQGVDLGDQNLAGGADIFKEDATGKIILAGLHQAYDDTLIGYELGDSTSGPPPWGKLDLCIPADQAPFFYLNQPWGWVEGAVNPGDQVSANLKRGGSTIASALTTADQTGWVSFDFRNGGTHTPVVAGDAIELSAPGVNETITAVEINGWIDSVTEVVAGNAAGGDYDVWGVACVRHPFETSFESREIYFNSTGNFQGDFSSLVDIQDDFIAQVVQPDSNDNYVVNVLFGPGMDINVLISEDRVEGVIQPGSEITAIAWNEQGEKGRGTAIADSTGFYSLVITNAGKKVNLLLGDRIGVSKPGYSRELWLSMFHESYLQPWNDQVIGTVHGVNIPADGTQGRIDLLNIPTMKWYTQYIWIPDDGNYLADFSGIANISDVDRIRLWVSDGNGAQQASFGSGLEFGVSTSQDQVWGFTTANSLVGFSLFKEAVNGIPQNLIGQGAAWSDALGYFSTTLANGGTPADISPGNILKAETDRLVKTMYIGAIEATGNEVTDILFLHGPAGAVVHISGFHPGQQSSDPYVWKEVTIGPDGTAQVNLNPADLRDGDIYDIVAYQVESGTVLERMLAIFSADYNIFLPLVTTGQ